MRPQVSARNDRPGDGLTEKGPPPNVQDIWDSYPYTRTGSHIDGTPRREPRRCPIHGGVGVKRMFPPDDEEKPFIARWNVLTRILLVETSVKVVARSAMDFADFDDGSSCHPSNERIERESGLSERTIRTAWQVLRGLGMAERVAMGSAHRKLADEYQLHIPAAWMNFPIYGPYVRKFNCLHCQKLITPQGNCTLRVERGEEKVAYQLHRMVFCPAPRATKGRDSVNCFAEWNERQALTGGPRWTELGQDVWKLFRQARGDDW